MYVQYSKIDEQKQGIRQRVERDPLVCYGAIPGVDASEFKRRAMEIISVVLYPYITTKHPPSESKPTRDSGIATPVVEEAMFSTSTP